MTDQPKIEDCCDTLFQRIERLESLLKRAKVFFEGNPPEERPEPLYSDLKKFFQE